MTWNYRVCEYPESQGGGFGLHEVYYAGGNANGWTENPSVFVGESKQDVIDDLRMALRDALTKITFRTTED